MKKRLNIITVIMLIMFLFLSGCNGKSGPADGEKILISVSIIPQETFVKAVAGEHADVVTLIPPGYSPSNHEPSPAIMQNLGDASIYFTIGVPAEESIIPHVRDFNNNIEIVHLENEVEEVYPHRYFEDEQTTGEHTHKGHDPHIWLSPKRVKVMIDVIARELSEIDKKHAEDFSANASNYKEKLSNLDESVTNMFKDLENRAFIMYHPSLGYFADDYGLEMYALESGGKEPSAKEMQKLVDFAREKNIKAVLYQAEIDSAQTESFASEIGGKSVRVEPLASNYIDNLRNIAETLKSVLN